jgi:hypothetical protein
VAVEAKPRLIITASKKIRIITPVLIYVAVLASRTLHVNHA